MLVCYLDDSDASISNVITIAGYVATSEAWRSFEVEVEGLCSDFGVDVIHGREFEGGKGCFQGWSLHKKIDFLLRLGIIMSPRLKFGISRSVAKDTYKKKKSGRKNDSSLSAYGFAFEAIVFALHEAKEFGTTEDAKTNGVSYMIEAGHTNNPDLLRLISKKVKAGQLHPSTSITFIDKKSCRAIQLADLYAFFSRRKAHRHHKTQGKIIFPVPELYFQHLENRLPHYTGVIAEPYRVATVERTKDTFEVRGFVTPI